MTKLTICSKCQSPAEIIIRRRKGFLALCFNCYAQYKLKKLKGELKCP